MNIKPLCMVKPVDTHWNSKSHMISCSIYLKPAIKDICTKKSVVAQYKTCPLKLSWEEWRILKELSPLLGVCHFFFASSPHFATHLCLTGLPWHLTWNAKCRGITNHCSDSTHQWSCTHYWQLQRWPHQTSGCSLCSCTRPHNPKQVLSKEQQLFHVPDWNGSQPSL